MEMVFVSPHALSREDKMAVSTNEINSITEITGTLRTSTGKGSARKLRVAGNIPAVLIGGGKEPITFAVSPKEIGKALLSPMRRNSLFKFKLEDGSQASHAMVKDVQIHLVKRNIRHVDFIRVDLAKEVKARVAIKLTGKSKQMANGATIQIVSKTVEVSCLPERIPVEIVFDTTDSDLGSTFASQLKYPEGVSATENNKLPIFTLAIRKAKEEAAAATAAPAAKAGAPAAASAAPAAAAKAPAKK